MARYRQIAWGGGAFICVDALCKHSPTYCIYIYIFNETYYVLFKALHEAWSHDIDGVLL